MPLTSDYQPSFDTSPTAYVNDPLTGAALKQARVRATTAQVNAGLDVVPARHGHRYRLVDVLVVAVGGAPAGATSVDVTSVFTVPGSLPASRKLFSCTIGVNFTQSKIMVPDATGTVMLADGASFTLNDPGFAIRLEKTGGALTGSTNIDVVVTYAVE